jgi:hypothetical protein
LGAEWLVDAELAEHSDLRSAQRENDQQPDWRMPQRSQTGIFFGILALTFELACSRDVGAAE